MPVFKHYVDCPVTEDVLPDKLSELLEVALADLKKCERSKKYRVEMMCWHAPTVDKATCQVCLAGSVMAKEFKLSPKQDAAYTSISDADVKAKIVVLSDLALGGTAGRHTQECELIREASCDIKEPYVPYRVDSNAWWKYMRALLRKIKELEKLTVKELRKLQRTQN